jgi:hypothetical protein
MTPDQMFESFRRASVSSLQMQQEMLKQWTQQWPWPAGSWPAGSTGVSMDWVQRLQARWTEFTSELLTRHRESLDTMYKLAIQLLDQMSRLYESKSPEEYSRGMEEVRGKMFEAFKEQSDTQLREFQKTAEKWFEVLSKG